MSGTNDETWTSRVDAALDPAKPWSLPWRISRMADVWSETDLKVRRIEQLERRLNWLWVAVVALCVHAVLISVIR